ncbi:hypothetical protein ABZ330_21135 [Streptomyces sp. NPDC006172]|uniref:hypothetical protein n=1 Tax=Streptomyces sp. NPDC006172 TaxID=3154470 RepID=UPI0033C22E7A
MEGLTRRQLLAGGAATGLGVTAGGVAAWEASGDDDFPDFRPRFVAERLVTNEWAYRNPAGRGARLSSDWLATSGSLFACGGLGWTGRPDAGQTGPDSASATDSAVFRLVSRRRDFGSVTVSFAVRLRPPTTTARTPKQDWDGAHVWLRYHSPQELYAFSFSRRDGSVVIKRKGPPHDAESADGGYATVVEGRHSIAYDHWHHVEATAANTSSGVRLSLAVDGTEVLRATDRAPGPLTAPGGVGLRVDNTELWFGDFWARKT